MKHVHHHINAKHGHHHINGKHGHHIISNSRSIVVLHVILKSIKVYIKPYLYSYITVIYYKKKWTNSFVTGKQAIFGALKYSKFVNKIALVEFMCLIKQYKCINEFISGN